MTSFKFRFILFFGLFVFISCGIISLLSGLSVYETGANLASNQGISVVVKANQLIDGDRFAEFLEDPSEDDPFYEEIRLALLDIKEAVGCDYLYTMAPVNGTLYQYVIDGSCDPSDEENFSALGDEEDISDYGDAPFEVMKNGGYKNSGLIYQEGWGWQISTYHSIMTSSGKIVGFIGCDFSADFIINTIKREVTKIVVVTLIFVVLGCFLIFILSHIVFGKMAEVSNQMELISEGAADLTQRIPAEGKNEVSGLARACNKVIESLEKIIANMQTEVTVLAESGELLNEKVQQNVSNIDFVVGNVNDITDKIGIQNERIGSIANGMKAVDSVVTNLDARISEQSVAIQTSSSAVEEISSNIHSVDHNVNIILNEYGSLVQESMNGRKMQEQVSEQIANIAKQSESLSEANAAISSIAEQTNLLAMNAAIEAAHAGDLGKGFGVVADEIRALAETSATQSTAITDLLNDISKAIHHVVESSQKSTDSFDKVNLKISHLENLIKEVQSGMQEEAIGVDNILQTMKILDETTRGITDTSQNLKSESKTSFQQIQELQELSDQTAVKSTEISAHMNDMKNTASDEEKASYENIQASAHVADIVNKFKVGK